HANPKFAAPISHQSERVDDECGAALRVLHEDVESVADDLPRQQRALLDAFPGDEEGLHECDASQPGFQKLFAEICAYLPADQRCRHDIECDAKKPKAFPSLSERRSRGNAPSTLRASECGSCHGLTDQLCRVGRCRSK